MRLAGDSAFVQHRAYTEGITRTEWLRKMAYPAPREYKFTELVTPVAGLVEGGDSTAVPKSATSTDPSRTIRVASPTAWAPMPSTHPTHS